MKIHRAQPRGLMKGSDSLLTIVSGFLMVFGFITPNYFALAVGLFLLPMWLVKREIYVDEKGVHSTRKFLSWHNDLLMSFNEMVGIYHEEPKNGQVSLYFRNDERAKKVLFSIEDARKVINLARAANKRMTLPKL